MEILRNLNTVKDLFLFLFLFLKSIGLLLLLCVCACVCWCWCWCVCYISMVVKNRCFFFLCVCTCRASKKGRYQKCPRSNDVELIFLTTTCPIPSKARPSRDFLLPLHHQRLLEEQQENPQPCRTDQRLGDHHEHEIGHVALGIPVATGLLPFVGKDAQLPGAHPRQVRLAALDHVEGPVQEHRTRNHQRQGRRAPLDPNRVHDVATMRDTSRFT